MNDKLKQLLAGITGEALPTSAPASEAADAPGVVSLPPPGKPHSESANASGTPPPTPSESPEPEATVQKTSFPQPDSVGQPSAGDGQPANKPGTGRKGKWGRPSKYSRTMLKRICALVARGLNYNQVADAVGIHRDTLNHWQRDFPGFSDALRKAKAMGIARRLERVEKAARKDWRADAWWLERVLPRQFGRRERLDVVDHGDALTCDSPSGLASIDFPLYAKVCAEVFGEMPALPTALTDDQLQAIIAHFERDSGNVAGILLPKKTTPRSN